MPLLQILGNCAGQVLQMRDGPRIYGYALNLVMLACFLGSRGLGSHSTCICMSELNAEH